jgi:hypothetical protein
LNGDDRHFFLIGQITAIATTLEHYLLSIFGAVLGKDDQSEAAIIFSYLDTFDRRVELVSALIGRKYKLNSATLHRWQTLRERIRVFLGQRNHVVHGVTLTHHDGSTTVSSPLYHEFRSRRKHARRRDMATEELDQCAKGGSVITE